MIYRFDWDGMWTAPGGEVLNGLGWCIYRVHRSSFESYISLEHNPLKFLREKCNDLPDSTS